MILKKACSFLILVLTIGFIHAQKIPAVTEFVPKYVSVVEDIEYVHYQD